MDGYKWQDRSQNPLKPLKVSHPMPSKSSRLEAIQFSGDLHNDLFG
jgi:hypothetical protein